MSEEGGEMRARQRGGVVVLRWKMHNLSWAACAHDNLRRVETDQKMQKQNRMTAQGVLMKASVELLCVCLCLVITTV